MSGKRSIAAAIALAVGAFGKVDAPLPGKDLFERRCAGCHSPDRDKEGPRLRGVYGRPAGSVSTFDYSDALKNAHITWDANSLNNWLTDPDKLVPDSGMAFRLDKPDERREIIGYLKELREK